MIKDESAKEVQANLHFDLYCIDLIDSLSTTQVQGESAKVTAIKRIDVTLKFDENIWRNWRVAILMRKIHFFFFFHLIFASLIHSDRNLSYGLISIRHDSCYITRNGDSSPEISSSDYGESSVDDDRPTHIFHGILQSHHLLQQSSIKCTSLSLLIGKEQGIEDIY